MLETFQTFFAATLGVSAGVLVLLVALLGIAGIIGYYTGKKK